MSQETDVAAVLDDLIHQFSDPHAFFRELIQNAIDAGSGEVEVEFEFDGNDVEGTAVAHINDFGEGMTREIIEGRLTRLFSSTKDDDLTKIGRFGIGFVSVYAVQPDAVAVDTARGGEAWRVLFKPDRTFELYSLDEPIEGTRIRVFKRMQRRDYDQFVERATKVIRKWCAHVAIPVYVSGHDVRLPFDVDAPIKTTFEEPGTRLVAGLTQSTRAPYGFYNRGLTLAEADESAWPGMTFKLDSRYLEHTLTRDRVLEDKNFHKAREILDRVHRQTLPDLLVQRLEALAAQGPSVEYAHLIAAFARWSETHPSLYDRFAGRRFLRDAQQAVSPKDLRKRTKVWVLGGANHLAHLMPEAIQGADASDLSGLIRRAGIPAHFVESQFVVPAPQRRLSEALTQAMCELAQALDYRLAHVRSGSLSYRYSPAGSQWYLPMQSDESWVDAATLHRIGDPLNYSTWVLDAEHSGIQRAEKLAETQPYVAAMLVFEMVLANTTRSAVDADRVVRAAYELAAQRD